MATGDATPLVTDALTAVPKRRVKVCDWRAMLSRLADDQREALIAAYNDPSWTAVALAEVTRRIGYPVAQGTITRHRRGECVGCRNTTTTR